eukprot:m.478197 g.478197  ORF g.478197 m.478197 type:complete len:356 (+) comp21691_c0_seq12:245-1312(+)
MLCHTSPITLYRLNPVCAQRRLNSDWCYAAGGAERDAVENGDQGRASYHAGGAVEERGSLWFSRMLPPLGPLVREWIKEDVPGFDYGGAVVGDTMETMSLYQKSTGVVAGCPFFDAVMAELNCKVVWKVQEGQYMKVADGQRAVIATVKGRVCDLLMGERTALNVLARASGIATRAHRLVVIKCKKEWKGVVAGTRKITPGFRLVEKHAMLVGGADMHRMDLSSMVMLKDNHIWSHGSITRAVAKARSVCGFSLRIEVETSSFEDADEAAAAGADIVMLDNLTPQVLGEVSQKLKAKYPHIKIEGSGGITEDSIGDYMLPTVDVLSTSSIHQGCPHVDFSLKVIRRRARLQQPGL